MARAVRLSSVTLLHPRQILELFGNILHCLIAQGLGQFVLKFWEKNLKKFYGIVQVKYKEV